MLRKVIQFIVECDPMELIMLVCGALLFIMGVVLALSLLYAFTIQSVAMAVICMFIGYVIISVTIEEIRDEGK